MPATRTDATRYASPVLHTVLTGLSAQEARAAVVRRAFRPAVTLLEPDGSRHAGHPAGHAADDLVVTPDSAVPRPDPAAAAHQDLVTEESLRAALAGGQLEVHYQPIISLARRKVVGVEALVRWRHQDAGLVPPNMFIPLAERCGLIVDLGAWVLATACRQAARWNRQGLRLEMAVNVSVRQVTRPGFADQVRRTLAAAGLEPRQLLLEVTESAVVEDGEVAARALEEIAATGVTVAIDDFGTGYSSLLYLKRYPIGVLKVDRSFVGGVGLHQDDDAIVASIVGLARAVGAICVAEGVETDDQLVKLLGLGCDRAQGFLFSPPVPACDLPAAVEHAESRARREVDRRRRPMRPTIEPVPEEVLSRILDMARTGASYATIASALNATGSVHPKGRRWHRSSVAALLASLQTTAGRSAS